MEFQVTFPYWVDNIFQLRGKPVSYENKKIGEIISVILGKNGIPLVTFKVDEQYINLIKEKMKEKEREGNNESL